VGILNFLGGLVSGWATYMGGAYCQKPGLPALMTLAAVLCGAGAILLTLAIGAFFRRDHERSFGSPSAGVLDQAPAVGAPPDAPVRGL